MFNAARVVGGEDTAAVSWRDSLYRAYRSSSQTVRVAVYGSKHDPSAFESLLKEFADIRKHVSRLQFVSGYDLAPDASGAT